MSGEDYLPDTFQNGWLWPLVFVALLPLVLYIIDRRRARRIDWPAVRFFLVGSRRRLRWLHVREAALVGVRTVMAAALAYAFLRPQSVVQGEAGGQITTLRRVVIVIDTSYSMTYRPRADGRTLLEEARGAALRALDDLDAGDEVVVLAGGGLLENVTTDRFDLPLARRAVAALEPTGGSFDLYEALERSTALARSFLSGTREVLVLTDLQTGPRGGAGDDAWELLRERLREDPHRPSVRIVDCGTEEVVNGWVGSLRSDDLLATTAQPVTFRGRVATRGEPGALTVRLIADGETIEEREVPPVSAAGEEVGIEYTARSTGTRLVRMEIAPDRLPMDDSRYLAVNVRDEVPVLIVGKLREPEGAARFVTLALRPRLGDVAPDVPFDPRTRASLAGERLEHYRLVVLTDPGRVAADDVAALERFVARGGGLLVFAGSGIDHPSVDKLLLRGGRELLGVRLLAPARTTGAAGWHPRITSPSHPALSIFSEGGRGEIGRVEVRGYSQVATGFRDVAILARVGDSAPWLLEAEYGSGRVVLVASSADTEDSNLPITPLFVPLLQQLARYLTAPVAEGRNVLLGESLRFEIRDEGLEDAVRPTVRSAVLTDPGGASLRTRLELDRWHPVVVSAPTRRPGFHRLEVQLESGARHTLVGAVNLDEEESRLGRAAVDELEWMETMLGLERTSLEDATRAERRSVVVRREHWPYALAAAVVLFLVEMALLRRFAKGAAATAAAPVGDRRYAPGASVRIEND